MKNSFFILLLFATVLISCNNEVKTIESTGGIRINLEISTIDLLNEISNYNRDSIFQLCLEKTNNGKYNSIEEFLQSFNKTVQETNPSIMLASYFISIEMKDRITFNSTNDEVIEVLKIEIQKKIDETIINLTKRLENFSEQPANIKVLEYNLILVEVPGLFEKQRICNLIQSTGNLGFWETSDNSEVFQYMDAANKKIVELGLGENKNVIETTNKEKTLLDEINSNNDSMQVKSTNENPLFSILFPNVGNEQKLISGAVVGSADAKDTALINKYLALRQINMLFPSNLRFLWTLKPIKDSNFYQLIAIKVTSRDGRAPLDGSVIVSVKKEAENSYSPIISMSMNSEGAKIWSRMTRDNIGKQIAIVLDNYVYSFPVVNDKIESGNSSISGDFSNEEADDLVSILNAGSCPVKLKVIAVDIKEAPKK